MTANRIAYLAQRLIGDFDEATGQTPDMFGSIVIYADDEAEARQLAESMLPPHPGSWLRVSPHMSGIPTDEGLKEIAAEQKAAEQQMRQAGGARADGTSDYYVS